MFCDEPTTGLDSFNALSVIQSLKSLTQHCNFDDEPNENNFKSSAELLYNKAIICSIHQPTSDVFECFSHVILMRAGNIAFQGTVQQAENYYLR